MPSADMLQEYDVVPHTDDEGPVPYYRDPREIAAFLTKFLSFLVLLLVLILRFFELAQEESKCDDQDPCPTALSVRFWGICLLSLDGISVPLMAWAATRYPSQKYGIFKSISWIF